MAASHSLSTLDVCNDVKPLTMEQVRELVFQMGVPLNALDDIVQLFNGENRKQHFVQKWLDMFPDASWENLVVVLRMINMNCLANIESVYLRRATVTCRGSVILETTATASPVSAKSAPADPLASHDNSSSSSSLVIASFEKKVELARNKID